MSTLLGQKVVISYFFVFLLILQQLEASIILPFFVQNNRTGLLFNVRRLLFYIFRRRGYYLIGTKFSTDWQHAHWFFPAACVWVDSPGTDQNIPTAAGTYVSTNTSGTFVPAYCWEAKRLSYSRNENSLRLYNHRAFSQSIYLPLSFYASPFRRRWRHPIGGAIFAGIYFRRETRKTVSTYYRQRKSLRYLTPKNSANSTIWSSRMVLILGRWAVSI